ncbi:hypothetical protein [Haloferax marisrubri]|uniref:PGF-CTERM sorting domain-containing protein n=1 Tax=Haloferax marisrubri TaxID=1544719 RepID=A0A2P4NR11_9EURY|nr:hypothetical protein [Haloferax marisrubri]POG55587.1 hypothetical protein AUR65_009335 [Haloferax marisrubri]
MSTRLALVVPLGLLVLVSLGLGVAPAGGVTAQDNVSVVVTPASQDAEVGSTTTYDLVVRGLDGGGVGAADVTVSVDESVATVANASFVPDPGLNEVTYSDGRSQVRLYGALIDTSQSGSVTIATVTVESSANGTTPIGVDVTDVGSEAGVSYRITAVENGSLVVGAGSSNTTTAVERTTSEGSSSQDGGDGSDSDSESTAGELTVSAMGGADADANDTSSPVASSSSTASATTDGRDEPAESTTEPATSAIPTETAAPGPSILLTTVSLLVAGLYFSVRTRSD